MGSRFPDPTAPRWIQLGTRWQELLVVSEPTPWVSHWEPALGKSRKCAGPACALCHRGFQKQLRVVLMTIDVSGRDTLVELRERHRSAVDGHDTTVGLVIRMRRGGTARNSPVQMEVVGERQAAERDIVRLVDSFGLEPRVVGDPREAIERALPAIAEQLEDLELERGRVENPPGYESFE